jgi:serine/threonine protein kinase
MARLDENSKLAGGVCVMSLSPGSKLGPYEIVDLIGSGGMGEVWRARDTRLGRIVAIKKVKEQHSERFKQEAKTIAALNHPFVCQLFDIGPDYLVLEYVEGKPLSSPLPEREAVRLAIQIATALEAAHKKGIVHRDLKPANIIVTDEGSVKLLDFGLAKLYEQDAASTQSPTADFPATQAGAVLGTVAYMSPEQAQGKSVDARSDIFSFGLVLYEIISGRRAFPGESSPEILAALLRDEPARLQTSTVLEKIIGRSLAKQPSARYQTISEVKTALEQASRELVPRSPAEPQPSIAVLPFVNMSGDKEQEYFSDGLAEEIINALAQIPGLKVTARTSAFAFKGKQEDIRKIAEALGVANVLEGSVRKAANRIRVTAQLISATDGNHIWSERYDREMTDVFAIQDEISQAISEKLRVRLFGDRPLVKRATENLEAFSLYLKARQFGYRSSYRSPDVEKVKAYCEQVIAIDPGYAKPWYGLATLYFAIGMVGITPPKVAFAQCRQATLRALALDELLPEAHSVLAGLRAIEFDWEGAEREFRRALELGPGVSDIWMHYSGTYLGPMGQWDEAIAASQRSVELDPLNPFFHYHLGLRYYNARQYDRSIEQHRKALELEPNYPQAYNGLANNFIQIGKPDEAVSAMESAARFAGHAPLGRRMLGSIYARVGRIADARKILDEMQKLSLGNYVPPTGFAMIHLGLGETDLGFDWLEKAVDEQDSLLILFIHGPMFDPICSHPRYHTLLRKMKLEA